MGCPSLVKIGNNIAFSVVTHDADTGERTDASSSPTYKIYEEDTTASIASGVMAKHDTETGFYLAKEEITTANGFEPGKSYNILIEATVDGVDGGISFAFQVEKPVGLQKAVAFPSFQFPMISSSDHVSRKSGLGSGVTAQRLLDNGSWEACDNTVSEKGYGFYIIDLSADDMNGDVLSLRFSASGADDTTFTWKLES